MKRAIVLQHLERETPGQLGPLCAERGLALEIHQLSPDRPPPRALAPDELLIIMGGSMGVGDLGDPRYPFLAQEVELVRAVLAHQQPVLGICLGAQLLAHAAGARVYPNVAPGPDGQPVPVREVGFGSITRVEESADPIFQGLPTTLPVVHWHGDTFDLPIDAVHLAKSDRCPHQAFRIGARAVGLQFHPEVDAVMIRRWAREDADFVIAANGPGGPDMIIAQCDAGCQAVLKPGRQLLGNILDQLMASPLEP
jgi:GMP synthase (glutamine-hydrolysing)